MLTVWGRKSSSNVQALMWCVAELDLPFQRHDAGFKYGVNDTPEFLAMNPNGLVPVLIDGDGEALWETGAILRYLGNRYGKGAFWPEDPAHRAHVDKWAEWSKLNVAAIFTSQIFWKLVRTAPRDRNEAALREAVALFGTKLDIAEKQLSNHPFLAGDAFTLADIQFGHLLYRYFDLPIDRPQHPALAVYYDALKSRPAFKEHVMVPYDELRVT